MRAADWVPPEEFDEYRIIRPLGQGGMGTVFLAHDTLLDRVVAVKFISRLESDGKARERFLVEARATARLMHPNVVQVHRVGLLDGQPYLVSEFVRGRSLAELEKPIRGSRLLELALGLARGLAAAHERGVLHRDLKPANAVLADDGEVKLLDFGIAKLLDQRTAIPETPVARRPIVGEDDVTFPAGPRRPRAPRPRRGTLRRRYRSWMPVRRWLPPSTPSTPPPRPAAAPAIESTGSPPEDGERAPWLLSAGIEWRFLVHRDAALTGARLGLSIPVRLRCLLRFNAEGAFFYDGEDGVERVARLWLFAGSVGASAGYSWGDAEIGLGPRVELVKRGSEGRVRAERSQRGREIKARRATRTRLPLEAHTSSIRGRTSLRASKDASPARSLAIANTR